MGFGVWDFIVIIVFFVVVLTIGSLAFKKVRTIDDFYLGGRRFGKLLSIAQSFGTGTNAAQLILVAGASYQLGIAGIWYQWYWLFLTPFFWLLAPVYRRMGYVTLADFFQERYGDRVGRSYALVGLLYIIINSGLMLKSIGITIEAITDGKVPFATSIITVSTMIVIYGLTGGLFAAALTDLIQGVITIIFSFIIVPFALARIGGFSALHQQLPANMFDMFAISEVTPFFLIATTINGFVAMAVYPHHMAMMGSAKDELTARIGWVGGTFIKRFITIGWVFTGIFCAVLFPGLGVAERDMAFGLIIKEFIPAGLLGFMIAALLASIMSSCDAYMLSGAALVTQNLSPLFRSEKLKSLLGARIFSIIVLGCSVLFAFFIPSLTDGLKILWRVMALFGIAFWAGILWPKANATGAVASIFSAFFVIMVTGDINGFGLHWSIEKQISAYLPIGLIAMIIGSHFTNRASQNKLKDKVPKSLIVDSVSGRTGLLLLDIFNTKLEKLWSLYKIDIGGVLVSLLIIILLSGLLYLLTIL